MSACMHECVRLHHAYARIDLASVSVYVLMCVSTCVRADVFVCLGVCPQVHIRLDVVCVCMYACRLCALPAVLVRLLICRVNVSLCVLICVYMYVRLKLCTSPAVLTCVYHTRICYTDMVSTYIDMTYCACISYHHVSTRATHISHMSSKCE